MGSFNHKIRLMSYERLQELAFYCKLLQGSPVTLFLPANIKLSPYGQYIVTGKKRHSGICTREAATARGYYS